MSTTANNFPKLHNAMWPGLVGKGSPGAEPSIDFDTMLNLTAQADVDGVRFDGIDLFLYDPHLSIEIDDDNLKRVAEKVLSKGFLFGSVVAPVWPPTGGGSAMGTDEDRQRFVGQVRKACRIGRTLRDLGARPYGVVRIDSACSVADWAKDPETNQARIARAFSQACDVAADFGERLAAEGEICWGGMHSWKQMLNLLERVNRPQVLGFQADMAHTLLYVLGYNAPEDAILPPEWDWSDPQRLDDALRTLTDALRPWTIDFHVAQNDATVHGSGTHDKTGHHCLPNDPQGKLSIAHHAGFWLRGAGGQPTRAFRHVCWDGCMFPNAVMMQPETWNEILRTLIAVRDAHGWHEEPAPPTQPAAAAPAAAPAAPAQMQFELAAPKPPRKPAVKKAAPPAREKASKAPVKKAPARPKKKPAKPAAKPPPHRPHPKAAPKAKRLKAAAKTRRAKPARKAPPARKPQRRKRAR